MTPILVDHLGRPLVRQQLTQELAAPTLTGVRQVVGGHPASGLTPERLARLLREAEDGDPTRYLELAEDMEERDLHYQAVLGTRKRAIAQLDVKVEAASDERQDVAAADLVREWLDRDELQGELFHILDAVGKGFSVTEVIWDTSGGRWMPGRLEWRDPRWFELDRADGRTVLLRGDGPSQPLPAPRFIVHTHQAKSGLPIRGGLARVAAWAWMFKHFAVKDWVVFAETYGQPVRLGRYGPEATAKDRDVLWQAVSSIASDCAAIIPKSMEIEFVRAEGAAINASLFQNLADWFDRQISKAVLGQTTTTDAVSGGHAVSQEHREVQKDIERADAAQLASTLNRGIVRDIVDFNLGRQRRYPRIRIGRPEATDIKIMSEALARLVPLGLRIEASQVRDLLGFTEPATGAEVLAPPAPAGPGPSALQLLATQAARRAPERGPGEAGHAARRLAARLDDAAGPGVDALLRQVQGAMAKAGDLDDLRRLLADLDGLDVDGLADLMAPALAVAQLAGRAAVDDGD